VAKCSLYVYGVVAQFAHVRQCAVSKIAKIMKGYITHLQGHSQDSHVERIPFPPPSFLFRPAPSSSFPSPSCHSISLSPPFPMIQLWGLWEHCKLPPSGSRHSLADKRFLADLKHEIKRLITTIFDSIFRHLTVKRLHKQIHIERPLNWYVENIDCRTCQKKFRRGFEPVKRPWIRPCHRWPPNCECAPNFFNYIFSFCTFFFLIQSCSPQEKAGVDFTLAADWGRCTCHELKRQNLLGSSF